MRRKRRGKRGLEAKTAGAESSRTVLVGITASIAAYRACDLILDLRRNDITVIPVLSKDAHHFITPLTVQSVAAHEVYSDFFSLEGRVKPIHIELAKQADLIVIAPASADVIARLSLGLADDLLTCTVLASRAPLVIVPAMNDKMYEHPATQENIQRLKRRGADIIPPIVGDLICSDNAMGHVAENKTILEKVLSYFGRT